MYKLWFLMSVAEKAGKERDLFSADNDTAAV